MSSSSGEIFAPLYNFLKASSLDKITTSSIITKQWNCFKIQLKDKDFNCLMGILKDMKILQGKFEEVVNWKTLALNNMTLLKDKIKVINICISYLRNSNLVFLNFSHKINIFDWIRRKIHQHTNIFL